jgi:hypothetical protein
MVKSNSQNDQFIPDWLIKVVVFLAFVGAIFLGMKLYELVKYILA